jgi:hypothetical protein
MNGSMRTAGRGTHIRIIAVSLMAALAVVASALHARNDLGARHAEAASPRAVMKVSRPTVYSAGEFLVLR